MYRINRSVWFAIDRLGSAATVDSLREVRSAMKARPLSARSAENYPIIFAGQTDCLLIRDFIGVLNPQHAEAG